MSNFTFCTKYILMLLYFYLSNICVFIIRENKTNKSPEGHVETPKPRKIFLTFRMLIDILSNGNVL